MKNEPLVISNGIYTLSETENEEQLKFFRNDEEVLDNIGDKPIEFYYAYLIKKIANKELEETAEYTASFELSDDKKYVMVNIINTKKKSYIKEKKMNILERIYCKIFG